MLQLVFATNNANKLEEIKNLIPDNYDVKGLKEVKIIEEIPETHETLKENAIEKALYIYNKYKLSCFADDTGLEVDALNGAPGVYSARYAGVGCTYDDNVNKMLKEMALIKNRKAVFRTVIALVEKGGNVMTFEGQVNGIITVDKSGKNGFGYDPIFKPDGFNQTFAEMTIETKNRISHRGRALEKFINYLKTKP
jgi:XTP/dITP diphosphohydrolase